MNYEGERFLLKLYRELYNEEEVKHSGTKSDDKFELINKYMNRLEKSQRVFDGNHESLEKYMRERYYDRYIIKEEDIPESYFEQQKRIALERGEGFIAYNTRMKHEEAQKIIEEQKKSLDKWLDYLMKENTSYPMWARYWAFQGMLKLGIYDKKKNSFTRRSKGTTAPFIELNPEALSYAIETVTLYQNGKDIDDEELKKLVQSGNFGKIYSHNLWKTANDEASKDNTNSLEGKWVHYENGDAPKVVKALSGKGTGWCIASESTAASYLSKGTFDIYFTKDSQGEYTNPRACIRTENRSIAEVRGINPDQNMEPEVIDIVDKKLDNFSDKEKYKRKVHDMKEVTRIYNKVNKGEELSRDDLLFIYETQGLIEGFGWQEDPRLEIIKTKAIINNRDDAIIIVSFKGENLKHFSPELQNDKEVVLAAVKQNGKALEYASAELQNDKEVVLEAVKQNGEALYYASENLKDNKEIVLIAVKQNSNNLEYASENLKDDKEVVLEAVKQKGNALYYASERLKDDEEVVLVAVKQDGEAIKYASQRLKNDKEFILELVRQDGNILCHISRELQNDRDIVLEAVKQNGYALKYASENLKNDKEIVLEAMDQNIWALEYASPELRNDKEVILKAVKRDGMTLEFASQDLRNDKEIVLEAVKRDPEAIKFASPELQNDPDILEVINQKKEKREGLSKH